MLGGISGFVVMGNGESLLRAEAAPAPQAGVRPLAIGKGVRLPDQSGTRPGVAPPTLPEKPPRPPSPRPREPAKRV